MFYCVLLSGEGIGFCLKSRGIIKIRFVYESHIKFYSRVPVRRTFFSKKKYERKKSFLKQNVRIQNTHTEEENTSC